MAFLSLIWILLFVFLAVTESQKTCTDINMFSNLVHGKYSAGSDFQTHSNTTLLLCVKECQLRKRCASFNFEERTGRCVLNVERWTNSSSDFRDRVSSVYSDIIDWPSSLAGACASHTCPEYTKCEETEQGQYECIAESCVDPPDVDHAEILALSRFTDVGAAIQYKCNPPRIPAGEITCQPNGSWVGNFTCMRLRNCDDIKACNSSYGDGEYVLYMLGSEYRLVKVYCQYMEENSEEYLTLKGHTYSEFVKQSEGCGEMCSTRSCGKTVFEKVRLWPMKSVLRMNNYEFATSNNSYSPLGWAGVCSLPSGEPVHGSFRIDLSGTGLKVASSVTWTSINGNQDPIWNRTSNGTVVTGECGGSCDYCRPTVDNVTDWNLPVELDPSFDLDLSQATYPICSGF